MSLTVGPGAAVGPGPASLSSAAVAERELALAAAIRRGDEQAFEALYRAYHAPLWRFARVWARSSTIAEELVQEVFLAIWRRRTTWVIDTSVRAWLYAAVRNLALKHRRRLELGDRILEDTTDGVPGLGAAPVDSHDAVEGVDLEAAIARAIEALPERRRIAITLRWKHALAPAEIAHVLGTSPESVRVLLSRARTDLAALIGYARSR